MEIASTPKMDYTLENQYYDGRKQTAANKVEDIKGDIRELQKEESSPEVMQMLAEVTGLGKRLDLSI